MLAVDLSAKPIIWAASQPHDDDLRSGALDAKKNLMGAMAVSPRIGLPRPRRRFVVGEQRHGGGKPSASSERALVTIGATNVRLIVSI
jgi:hypothetical protein